MLLTILLDLTRNGLGHLFQPTVFHLKGGNKFNIVFGSLSQEIEIRLKSNDLCYDLDQNGDIRMTVYPEYLLRHVELAVEKTRLLDKCLKVKHFDKNSCDVSVQQLVRALRDGGFCPSISIRFQSLSLTLK